MNLADSRILVTGGAGFIGSALVWALNRRGAEDILVTDVLGRDDKWRNLRALRFRDYLEADELAERLARSAGALGRFDLVLHLGACSATTERDAAYLVRNNTRLTQDLCRWALGQEARFVYASSAATYGDGAAGMADGDPASLPALRPLNMYGYSKHLFDLWAWRAGLLGRITGLKYFNVFGPNEAHKGEMRSLVDKAFHQVRATGRIRLFRSHRPDFRDGEQRRDFLYVKDAVAATLHLAATPAATGLFNVGSGTASTWLELAGALCGALGREPAIEFVDMPPEIRETYQYHTCADISRLRATGYDRPMTPLPEAVRDYVQGYLLPGRHLGDETA